MIDSNLSINHLNIDQAKKTFWIVANWKSNKTIQQALEWLSIVGPQIKIDQRVRVVVCPTFVLLPVLKKEIMVANFPILLGAQDLSPFDIGAYTGEVPGKLIAEFVDVCILGHSERRVNFKETDAQIEQKVKMARISQIEPIVCFQGEDTPIPNLAKIVAFEPVSAIGSGKPDTPEHAQKIAQALKQKHDLEVLYGGSVHSGNALEFLVQADLSGLLVGQASLDPEEFVKIVSLASKA